MDFDANKYLYFGDRSSSSIWKVTLNGVFLSNRFEIIENTQVWSLAYDWINHDLYWSDDMYVLYVRVVYV